MLALALLLVGCTALQSHALPALVQYQAKDELGQYSYGYSGGPSAKHEERTLDGVTRGSYSYIDGNGLVQTRSYEADDWNGFRVVGTDINAPSGVASKPVTTTNTALPVSHHATFIKTYQPVSYINSGYDTIDTISGNEVSFTPVAETYSTPVQISKTVSASVPVSPYSSALEYVESPYRYRLAPQPVAYSTKYVRPYALSSNSLEVSPLSSYGVRYPSSSYSERVQPIAFSDSLAGIQSTVTPPTVQTVYSNKIPIEATVSTPIQTVSIPTRTYQTASSQVVSSYVPNAIAYTRPAPIAITDSAPATVTYTKPSVVGIANTLPAPIAYTDAAPAPVAYTSVTPSTITYTKTIPTAVTYTDISPNAVTYTRASPSAVTYTQASPFPVTYTNADPAVTYSSAAPSIAYGYYPTSSIVRYASAAPSVQAAVYTPAEGFTYAQPVPLQQAIATQYHAQDELGQYRYGYSNVNSAKEESKTLDGVTRGSFSYVDANGVLQSRSYVSDDISGFRVIGTDIPKSPDGQVNPDAIPSEHVNVAPAPAAPAVALHSQQIIATAAPAQLVSHGTVEVNPPVFVSSTPATVLY